MITGWDGPSEPVQENSPSKNSGGIRPCRALGLVAHLLLITQWAAPPEGQWQAYLLRAEA